MKKSRKLLLKAAKLIKKHGWCQGEFEAPTGEICMSRALGKAAKGDDFALCLALSRLQKRIRTHVPIWNDLPRRTKKQVITALQEAAK